MKSKLPKRRRSGPNYTRKLSAVLFEFVEEIVPIDSEPRVLEEAVTLAVALWNLPLLPEDSQAEGFNRLRQLLARVDRLDLHPEILRFFELRKTRCV